MGSPPEPGEDRRTDLVRHACRPRTRRVHGLWTTGRGSGGPDQ
ncbi:MAG: hypothetical protein AVDCRST_MAG36-553 [uncultured Nocardioidaceae bacterium]|uniref:Uncharacterized protein n=1 Tax=uncultured Nocardioidaceae bacterium TaxID=253824 RepID=A0A6J4L7U7_9ACTN|nr:MAG: hypothetical protein AVDCRST_MAG36-553 [uncultured Nocardioidaceae bacterium]